MVLPPGHRLADAEFVEPEELAGDRMVVRRHCEALPEIDRFFTQRGVRPRFVLKTTSDHRALAVVRAGQGIGMMPECFADPQVRMVRVADFDLTRDIGILYAASGSNAGIEASPFLALMREHYGADHRARNGALPSPPI
jgi:DNA-binding transcriptional LysR family regulator